MLSIFLRLKGKKKKEENEKKTFVLCHWKAVARQRCIQRQKRGKEWQAECMGSFTGAHLSGALTHSQVAATWGGSVAGGAAWREHGLHLPAPDRAALRHWINFKNFWKAFDGN